MHSTLAAPLPDAPRPIAFSVLRVPFFLEPDYDESKPYIEKNRDRLIKKWGGVQGWEAQKLRHDLKGRGKDAGIEHFNLDRLTANSMASHRLVQFVGKKFGLRVSEGLYDRLNVYYFVEGHSLNDKQLLAEVASKEISKLISLSCSNVESPEAPTQKQLLTFLNGNEGRDKIESAIQRCRDIGINSIPKFIIEGRTLVDGAARSDVFVEVFREIEMRGEVYGSSIFGDILGISKDILNCPSHGGISEELMAVNQSA